MNKESSNNNYPNHDNPVSSEDYPLDDYSAPFEQEKRIPDFFNFAYLLDLCIISFVVYYSDNLDLSMVPEVYDYAGWESWLWHLEISIYSQILSAFFAVFQLSFPFLQKTSFFYSIFNLLDQQGIGTRFITVQLFIRSSSLAIISPAFGMTTFGLSGNVFFIAFLWHFFIAISLLIWLIDRSKF